ncbi:MAG TPA: FAD binding domain-containing protein, partial [Myxococcaceae bacterium]|nr:FAD binding domain-containing protein [Myxococcaceae bacterium]
SALKAGGEGSMPLSGGQSLIPILKLRLASPESLIDLARIPGLRRINADEDPISIGALTTHAMIEDSAALREVCPLLPEVASGIGDQQVRNRGTIGGSLAHADPAADWPAAILALDAELIAASLGKKRSIRATEFFRGLMTTALAPGELLVEIRIRRAPAGGAAYQKVRQSASGFAIAGVAASLEFGPDRICKRASIGITGVAGRAFRAAAAEKAIQGQRLDERTIAEASAHAVDGVSDPLSDLHASGEYRLHLARVHCARALRRAAGLAARP